MMKAMIEDGLRSEKGAVPTGKRKLWKKFEKNKKTLKNLKKPLAIPKNYAIISLACEGNENKETKQATIK